jgi:serine/threonine protein kinase/Tfp pilus assembly protein PilF
MMQFGQGRIMGKDQSDKQEATSLVEGLVDHEATKLIDDSREQKATTPARTSGAPHFAELKIEEGYRVGRYVLGAKVGEGGMGSVFIANQLEPVKRRVAFKVIQLGMNTEELLRRFEAERQILALLKHPNIATMLDAGATPEGRPYFVMEFVDGIEIDEFCAQKRLTIRERVVLFLQVLAGVEHAHQKGIIHRDIKPGNIVISHSEGKSVAKIIDFGIAKSLSGDTTGEAQLTQHDQVIGTPNYMAPEQARHSGESLDVRTDIFSLGVVLFELLVGVSPFERRLTGSDNRDELSVRESMTLIQGLRGASSNIQRLAEERRVTRRALGKKLSGDIASVVLKALKNERAERYRSVSEFADDLGRFLDGYPVIAKPRRFWYLAVRYALRNKAIITSALVVTVALIATTIAAVMGFIQAEKAAQEANLIAEFQATQLSEIDASGMGQDLQAGMLEKVRAEQQRRGLGTEDVNTKIVQLEELLVGANFTDLALEMLDVNIFDRALLVIDRDFNEQPVIQARLWQTVADTLFELGRLDRATAPQKNALESRRRLLGDEHPDTLSSINSMAELLDYQGKMGEAEPYYREALESRRRVLGDEHPDTLVSIDNMGYLLQDQGKLTEAEPYYREALKTRRRVLGDEHVDTLESITDMGLLLKFQGKISLARPYYDEALVTKRRVLGNEHPDTVESINNMGVLLQDQGKLDEAEPYYREALEINRRMLGDEHLETLNSISNMGSLLKFQGKTAEAEPYYNEALDTKRRVLGDEHPDTLISINNTARFLRDLGSLEEAEALGREATEVARTTFGNQHVYLGAFLSSYGQTLTAIGRFDEAEKALVEAYAILSDPDTGSLLYVQRPVRALIDL